MPPDRSQCARQGGCRRHAGGLGRDPPLKTIATTSVRDARGSEIIDLRAHVHRPHIRPPPRGGSRTPKNAPRRTRREYVDTAVTSGAAARDGGARRSERAGRRGRAARSRRDRTRTRSVRVAVRRGARLPQRSPPTWRDVDPIKGGPRGEPRRLGAAAGAAEGQGRRDSPPGRCTQENIRDRGEVRPDGDAAVRRRRCYGPASAGLPSVRPTRSPAPPTGWPPEPIVRLPRRSPAAREACGRQRRHARARHRGPAVITPMVTVAAGRGTCEGWSTPRRLATLHVGAGFPTRRFARPVSPSTSRHRYCASSRRCARTPGPAEDRNPARARSRLLADDT